jgi:phosphoglycolate phosphatase-like HAD superfamily hydrolase
VSASGRGSRRLFLFDIDGTLVTAGGAGRIAIGRALAATYGTAGAIESYDFRGKTDPRIVWDLMRGAGLDDTRIADKMPECFRAYVAELDALIGDGARVRIMPGIGEVVKALAARDDAVVGLLTGNVEAGARVKLRPTGLWPLFRVGAFGSDDLDRRKLPAVACERAERVAGHRFGFAEVTIIGDTPLDVDCARACGAVAVAVATGFHPAEDLTACGPDLFFRDFSDVAAVLAALTGAR